MTTDLLHPLGPEDLVKIEDALARIKQAELAGEMAQRAGIDVTAEIARMDAVKSKLLTIKQVYFPGQ